MNFTQCKKYLNMSLVYLKALFKWLTLSALVGIICGGGGLIFHLALGIAEELFLSTKTLIFLLPFLGLIIVWLYNTSHMSENKGTNGVFDAVRAGEHVSPFLAPIIFVSTVLTHLGGGSAGREGAALQMGGSMGSLIGRLLRLNQNDLKIITVCGMSATFCGLFGTPLTAALFALEVINVGVFNYSALVACMTSSFTAYFMMRAFDISPMFLKITGAPTEYLALPMAGVMILAAACAAVSILWCIAVESTPPFLKRSLANPYLRVAVSGISIIVLTFIMGNNDYNGSGMRLAQKAVAGEPIFIFAFLIKILFTVITLGGGFRGGEIVPTLCIGATFGSAVAPLLGLNSGFAAAVGMVAVFCGSVNCPISSIILSAEIFGSENLLYFAAAAAISYMISGRYSLYSSQKLVFSKLSPMPFDETSPLT